MRISMIKDTTVDAEMITKYKISHHFSLKYLNNAYLKIIMQNTIQTETI